MKEREKRDPSCSYFLESASATKEISHPFLFLWGGKELFQKILEASMIYLNLEVLPQ
jgi:hypothetical protein